MLNALGQFVESNSFLHKLDPRTKLFMLLTFAVIVLIDSALWNHSISFMLLILATAVSKIKARKIFGILWSFRIFIMITFLIHLIFTPSPDAISWGIFHVGILGVFNGLLFSLRMLMLLWAASLFGHVTSPIELADSLEKMLGFVKFFRLHPRDISMIVILAMRYVPTVIDDAKRIRWAQIARGGNISKGLLKKMKSIIPMVIPLFATSFRRADKLALALTLRGYNPTLPRTKLKPIVYTPKDYCVSFLTLLSLISAIVYRYNLLEFI